MKITEYYAAALCAFPIITCYVVHNNIGLGEHVVWEDVKHLTAAQATRLGLKLNKWRKAEIDEILRKEHSPGLGALALFLDWKSDLVKSDKSEYEIFHQALDEVLQSESDPPAISGEHEGIVYPLVYCYFAIRHRAG